MSRKAITVFCFLFFSAIGVNAESIKQAISPDVLLRVIPPSYRPKFDEYLKMLGWENTDFSSIHVTNFGLINYNKRIMEGSQCFQQLHTEFRKREEWRYPVIPVGVKHGNVLSVNTQNSDIDTG